MQFLGLPLAAVTALLLWPGRDRSQSQLTTRAWGEPIPPQETNLYRWYRRINAYALVFWITLVSLNLAGWSRGEEGRTFIFLMPLALVAFYLWAGRCQPPSWTTTALFFAQIAVAVIIGARWLVP